MIDGWYFGAIIHPALTLVQQYLFHKISPPVDKGATLWNT
jgi:hypothetical protein